MAFDGEAPAGWWNNLTVVLEEFIPRVWVPSGAVKSNHDLMSEWRSNDFDINNKDYTTGIITCGAVFVAIGAAMLLLVPIIYCCVAKVACCCRSLKHSHPKDSRLKWIFLLASACTICGGALSITGFVQADNALNSAAGNAQNVGNTLVFAADLIESVLASSAQTVDALDNFVDTAAVCATQQDIAPSLNVSAFLNETVLDSLQVYFDDINDQLGAVDVDEELRSLADNAYSVETALNDTKTARDVVVISVFCANMLVVAVFIVLGWFNLFAADTKSQRLAKCSKWLACLASPVAIIVIFASWIITAGSVMLSALSGDYCVDPNYNTIDVVGNTSLVQFYLLCHNVPNAIPVVVYTARLALAKGLLLLGSAFDAAFNKDSCMYTEGALPEFSNALYGNWLLLEEVQGATACSLINSIYADISYTTMCTDVTKAMRLLVIGSIMLAVSLLCAMLIYRILVEQRSNFAREKALLEASEDDGDGSREGGGEGDKRVYVADAGTAEPAFGAEQKDPARTF